jgi:hypothetical protein
MYCEEGGVPFLSCTIDYNGKIVKWNQIVFILLQFVMTFTTKKNTQN